MLRRFQAQYLAWPEKTMSVMLQQKTEACIGRLKKLPSFGIWQKDADDLHAEELWQISYDAQENPTRSLHTMESLRSHILKRLPVEFLLLSVGESFLVQQLLRSSGTIELDHWTEFSAAEGLIRRLWCTVSFEKDESVFLHMPSELTDPLNRMMSQEAYHHQWIESIHFHNLLQAALQVTGMIYAEDVLSYLHDFLPLSLPSSAIPAERMLTAAFDYVIGRDGRMILVHPGLAEPEKWIDSVARMDLRTLDSFFSAESELPSLTDAEIQALEMLSTLIEPLLRPEQSVQIAVQDLSILARQDVPLAEMEAVLATQLAVRPTREMLDCLRLLHSYTPRFACIRSRVVN